MEDREYKGRRVFRGMSVKRYPSVYWPDHPKAQSNGCIYVHQDVALDKYGEIPDGYEVDHDNENIWDWSFDNIILRSKSEHAKKHNPKNERITRPCALCGHDVIVFTKRRKNSERVYCDVECQYKAQVSTDWPDIEIVFQKVVELGFTGAGRFFGVTDNTVRKRLRRKLDWCPSYDDVKVIRQYL